MNKNFFLLFLIFFCACRVERVQPLFNSSNKKTELFFSDQEKISFGEILGPISVGFGAHFIYPSQETSLTGYGTQVRRLIPPNFVNVGSGGSYCRPFQGVDHYPRVKAILFRGFGSHGELKYYLILSYDIVAIPIDLNLKIMDILKENFEGIDFNDTNTNIFATHTHSGPAGLSENPFWAFAVCDRFNPDLFYKTKNATITAVQQAFKELKPINNMDVADTKLDRYNQSRFKGMEADASLSFFNFNSVDKSIGCLVSYGVHATWYGMDDIILSADYAGYLEEALQNKTSASTCVFLNGTEGNAAPAEFDDKYNFVQKFSEDIFSHTQKGLPSPNYIKYGSAFIKIPAVKINYEGCNIDLHGISTSILENLFTIADNSFTNNVTKIGWFSIGDKYFFLFPGEPLMDIKELMSTLIKKEFPDISSFSILSLANDHTGYLMTPDNYHKSSIETCSTMHGPENAIVIVNSLINSLKASRNP